MNKTKEGVAAIHNNIRKILKGRKRGYRGFELKNLYYRRYGTLYQESGFTARLREMGDVVCDLSTYRYNLECNLNPIKGVE